MLFTASSDLSTYEVKQRIPGRGKSTISRLYGRLLSIIGYMGRDPGALQSFRQTHPAEYSCKVNILYIPKRNVWWGINTQWLRVPNFNENMQFVLSIFLHGGGQALYLHSYIP